MGFFGIHNLKTFQFIMGVWYAKKEIENIKFELMQKILFTACLLIGLFSCVVPQPPNVPMQSHADVMTQDYPTKKSVFIKFGTPTSKETFENIENWYFKLSEVTASTSIGHSYGTGRISQNPMNPYFRTVDRELVTRQSQNTFQKTNSTTVETFVKFWFVNDTVIKWESYGVDFSRPITMPPIADTIPTSSNVVVPNYAIEFLYYQEEGGMFIYSHNSILRQINTGINGPMKYSELSTLMATHLDFKSATIPDIIELKKISDSDTKLRYDLMRNSLIVWSSTINPNGNVQCLNFRTGEIIEKSPDSNNHFVPIVKLLRK
ncbi:MAG: hypothetical protein RL411_591 [Bacteroidota bacterium]|jgi:hypothetical protein